MIRLKFFLILIFLGFLTIAQSGSEFTLKGEIDNFQRPETLYLLSVRGSSMELVDSLHSEDGHFSFLADSILFTGEYVIFWGDDKLLPVLIAGEKYIEIKADELEPSLQPQSIVSLENEIYYMFKNLKYKVDSLSRIGDYYYTKKIFDKLEKVQNELDEIEEKAMLLADSVGQKHPKSFALKIFKSSIPPNFYEYQKTHPDHGFKTEADFLRRHYFDHIDKNDSNLVRTSVIYDACSFYIRNLTAEKTTKGYIKASNYLVSNFASNDAQFNYVLELLLNTFEAADFGEVYIYLFDTYLETCHDGIPDEKERKALAFKNLKKGSSAPDITAKDRFGVTHSLSDYHGKIIVLMFWASTCPHCEEIMPEVVRFIKENDNLVFFNFSLDLDENQWTNGLLKNEVPEPALCDLGGFDGKNAVNWYIWATPTFFVIDREGKIHSKPMTMSQLISSVKELR